MKINDDLLSGEKVETAFRYFPPYSKLKMRARDECLLELARDRHVLHVGFLDHTESRQTKGIDGWFHGKLAPPLTASLNGLDVDEQAINDLKSQGWTDLFTWESIPKSSRYDLVLVPDVIEHVRNVGDFLDDLSRVDAELFVFSTPNAFSFVNRFLLKHEFINSDHLQWFSPWTIGAQLFRAGFELVEFEMCDTYTARDPIRALVNFLSPQSRGTMVVTAVRRDRTK